MRRFAALCGILFAVAAALPNLLSAQSSNGTIVGVVRNQQHENLSGASIQLLIAAGDSQSPVSDTTTDKDGRFAIVGIAPGRYTLRVSLPQPAMQQTSQIEIRDAATVGVAVVLAPPLTAHASTVRTLDRGLWWGSQFDNTTLHDLPTTRRIWSLLENQETSTITEHLDTGGLETGTPARFSAAGASWTSNQYALNGLDVTDPYLPGTPLVDPGFGELSTITAVTAAKPAMLGGGGVNLEMRTPQPTGELHGDIRSFYSSQWLQGNNLDSHLSALGFPGPERVRQLLDLDVQAGGRLPGSQTAWPFIASFSRQQVSKNLGGFADPIQAHVSQGMAELTPLSRDTRRLNVLFSAQHIFDSRDGADLHTDPSATLRRNDNFYNMQTNWLSGWGKSSEFSAAFGATHAILGSGFAPDATGPSQFDLALLQHSGSAQLATSGLRARYVSTIGLHTIRRGPLGSHSIDVGSSFNYGRITNRWDSLAGMGQVLVNGQGAEVIQWNPFTGTQQHTREVSLYAQDAWQVASFLVISSGLRLEDSGGRASGASGRIRWTTLDPRAGIAIPIPLRGLRLRAAWSRYGESVQGRYLDFGDPSALGGSVYAWQDANGDGRAQPQEISTLLRVFGGQHSGIDQQLQRPYTDEVTVGFDWPLSRWLQARAGVFRRDVRRRVGVTDIDAPLSSYDPVPFVDMGDDPVNTPDPKTLILYNRKASTLGQDFLMLTNPAGQSAHSKGFEAELSKPPGGRWGASASFVAQEALAATDPGNSAQENDMGVVQSFQSDPNALLYANGITYFDRGKFGRLRAYYRAPGGVWLSLVAKYYDGLPYARMLLITGFNQGPFLVRATARHNADGLLRTQFNATADARISKEFHTSHGSFQASVTMFNLLNSRNNTVEADLSGPTFQRRIPWAIQAPRITQIGLEWSY